MEQFYSKSPNTKFNPAVHAPSECKIVLTSHEYTRLAQIERWLRKRASESDLEKLDQAQDFLRRGKPLYLPLFETILDMARRYGWKKGLKFNDSGYDKLTYPDTLKGYWHCLGKDTGHYQGQPQGETRKELKARVAELEKMVSALSASQSISVQFIATLQEKLAKYEPQEIKDNVVPLRRAK